MSGAYESPYGESRSEWALRDAGRTLVYDVLVPANSEAAFSLPAAVPSYRIASGRYRPTAGLR